MAKKNVVNTYNGISFSLNGKEILSHAKTLINLEDIMLGEISQSPEDRYTA